jgi:tyrosine-specific transport protein
MSKDNKEFWLASASLVGTIIGVGVFGVPYAISRVGVVPALAFFLVLGGIQLLQHFYLVEAAMVCPDKLRLPGLVGRYVGPRARWVAAAANILGLWAGMIAYIIVGGRFLSVLLQPYLGGETYYYQIGWALVGSALIYFSLKVISRLGLVTVTALIAAFIVIFARAAPAVRLDNLFLFDIHDLFLPYGVLLFSLSGYPAILEMEDILEGKHERYRRAVVVGTLTGALLTITFGLVVYGVTGLATTEDAVTGLQSVLGGNIAQLAALLGFVAIMNCYLRIGVNMRHTLQYDFKLRRFTSWLMTIGVPIGIFLIGSRSFVSMISFSGAVFGGITAILVALLYISITKKKLMKEKPLGVPLPWAYVSIVILAGGALIEVVQSAGKLFK